MVEPVNEVHALEPEDFEAEVRSFDHWFGAVSGYISDLEHGHLAGLGDEKIERAERDRLITALCNYTVAETAALEASSGLVLLAPNRATQIFLSTQVADEGRHVEVMLQRLQDLGVRDPEAEVSRRAAPSIKNFKARLLTLVEAKEWDLAVFAQNVALEAMEFSVFRMHAQYADAATADMLERILRDERRHIGFGENELGRRIGEDPRRRLWIRTIKHEIDEFVLSTFEHTLQELQLPRDVGPRLGRDYLEAVRRLGVS